MGLKDLVKFYHSVPGRFVRLHPAVAVTVVVVIVVVVAVLVVVVVVVVVVVAAVVVVSTFFLVAARICWPVLGSSPVCI